MPILATKADNLEGDQAINATIARLAYEYDLPLWNFWLAVQPLPDHGLQPDGSHLTWAGPYFDDPVRMRVGLALAQPDRPTGAGCGLAECDRSALRYAVVLGYTLS